MGRGELLSKGISKHLSEKKVAFDGMPTGCLWSWYNWCPEYGESDDGKLFMDFNWTLWVRAVA